MKNNKAENNIAVLAAFLLGMGLGVAFCAMFMPEDRNFLISITIFFAVMVGILFITFMLGKFLIPYISRRKAAIRALGKDGIKVLRRDKTAKLAYKGIYALLDGKYPEAESFLQEALALADVRQNQMFCVEWLIKLYEAMENEAKIRWCYRKAVEYSPDNPEAQSRLGHAYFAEGNLDKAEYCFEQALRYDPNNGYSYYSLVKIYLVRGEDERAFETLEKLIKINENHPLAHSEFANYYAMQGNREKAEEECKKAQLCGYKEPEELNRRINAILSFNETEFSGEDLPSLYYRRIEKTEQE
ncbi:MAG: tetratricopeptide repeat protein [[Eubacterium] saphenum]|nr:tetratricopeptide repeat protein [[Eubacterium] saphenum]